MCIPFLKMFALLSIFSPVKPFLCCLLCVFKNIFSRYAFPFPSFPVHTHSFFFQFMISFSLIAFTSVYVCVTKYLVTICLDLITLVICTLFFFFLDWHALFSGSGLFLPGEDYFSVSQYSVFAFGSLWRERTPGISLAYVCSLLMSSSFRLYRISWVWPQNSLLKQGIPSVQSFQRGLMRYCFPVSAFIISVCSGNHLLAFLRRIDSQYIQ